MGKVLCVTLNTAIDHVIEVDEFTVGSTIRTTSARLVPAGKGVDVAVGVAILGGRAIATGFIGERSRELFGALRDELVELMFIEVPGATRINVTVFEHKRSRETHLQTTGYAITQAAVDQLTALLERTISRGDVVVIGGSLPPGAPGGLTGQLVKLCKLKGAYVILDASGDALLDGLSAGPQMVKPNLLELKQIIGRQVDDSDAAIADAGEECLRLGVKRVVISRGRRGIVVIDREQTWKASVDAGRNHSTAGVGSGDAVVAAFALSTLQDRDIEDAMRLGVACGAANLATQLPGRFSGAHVAELLPRVEVQRMS
jgi:1-phosphofructokinase